MTPALAEARGLETGYREIAIEAIAESTSNPRKRFGELEGLAASIREQGVLEPLIVRPHPDHMEGYELVAGARRLRAAALAGLANVPCLIRTLSDLQVLEIQVTENLQRKDVHPLEEADAYAALMKADWAYTVEAVAARVGRSSSYIYQRLKLRDLCRPAREAFEADEITAAHAVRLARLGDEQQADALHYCFHSLFGETKGERKPAPVALLDRWLEDHVAVDPTQRDVVTHYQPEFAEQLHALEGEDDAFEAATLVQLSDSQMPGFYLGRKDHGLIGRASWKEVKNENVCQFARRGAVVHGGPLRVLWVCAKKGCPKHWPVQKKAAKAKSKTTNKASGGYDWKAEQEKRQAAEALWEKVQPLAFAAIAKTVAGTKLTDQIWDALVKAVCGYDLDVAKEVAPAFKAAGVSLSMTTLPALVAFAQIADDCYDVEAFKKIVNKHKLKIDVAALVASVQPKATTPAAAKTSAKKATKKKGHGK